MENNLSHPSNYLKPEWIRAIRNNSTGSEKLGCLHPAQLQLIYDQQWFKLFVPKDYGGLEMTLPEVIQLEESLAWADGSVGWTVTLCAGAGWFSGFLAPDLANEIFPDPKVCLGGSGAPSGTASITENGYSITGRWKYATGASHITHFTANCMIKNGSENVIDKDGKPLVLPFVFNKKDVTIIADWDTTGLVATGSHSFVVNELNVSKNNSFKIASEDAFFANCIYKYPFLQFAETTLAANISGMAIHFLDLCEALFIERIENKKLKDYQKAVLEEDLTAAKRIMSEKRNIFYTLINSSWSCLKNQGIIPQDHLDDVSRASRQLTKLSLQQVNELYPYCGLIAASPSSEISRVWRDLHTASQHTLLALPF